MANKYNFINRKSLKVLEYDKILGAIANYASSKHARDAIYAIRPSLELDEAQYLLDLTNQAYRITFEFCASPSFSMEDRFEQYIIRRMECLHDAYAYHITLMQDLSVNSAILPSVMQLRKDFDQWEHDIMMQLTEQGIKTMQLQDIQPEIMADLIKMLVKGLEIQFFVQNKYDSYSPTFQMLVKRITRGFVSTTPSMTNN